MSQAEQSKSLTHRALLSLVNSSLEQVVATGIAFILTPMIALRLGPAGFGIWGIIHQITRYVTIADMNPSGALKLMIGLEQNKDDAQQKQHFPTPGAKESKRIRRRKSKRELDFLYLFSFSSRFCIYVEKYVFCFFLPFSFLFLNRERKS